MLKCDISSNFCPFNQYQYSFFLQLIFFCGNEEMIFLSPKKILWDKNKTYTNTSKGQRFELLHVNLYSGLGIFIYWTCNSMNNLLSYFGLVDAKIRASDKDLPVLLSDWWPFKLTLSLMLRSLHHVNYFFLRMFYTYLVKTP